MVLLFFFKQKTAYEMRISDWSSDVCSSDLGDLGGRGAHGVVVDREPRRVAGPRPAQQELRTGADLGGAAQCRRGVHTRPRPTVFFRSSASGTGPEIGRAYCRERVCQYV